MFILVKRKKKLVMGTNVLKKNRCKNRSTLIWFDLCYFPFSVILTCLSFFFFFFFFKFSALLSVSYNPSMGLLYLRPKMKEDSDYMYSMFYPYFYVLVFQSHW